MKISIKIENHNEKKLLFTKILKIFEQFFILNYSKIPMKKSRIAKKKKKKKKTNNSSNPNENPNEIANPNEKK